MTMALTQVSDNGLTNTGVTAATYGSSSAIPSLTIDAKGRVTSATTSAIDSTSIANGTSNVSVANNGAVDVVIAGTNRLQIGTSGLAVNGNAAWSDNEKALFGNSDDLQLYHDGTNSYVDNTAGDLYIKTDGSGDDVIVQAVDDIFIKPQGGENGIQILGNNAVKLAYDSAFKLETTSNGIDVTGTITCDGLTVDGTLTASNGDGVIQVQDNNNTGNAVVSYVQGIDSAATGRWYIGHASTSNQDLYISNQAGGQIRFRSSNSDRIIMQAAGHLVPDVNNSIDLGNTSNRWRNVYTNDLNLSNEGSANDVDGTWGNFTIQEGEDDLFLINRRNGKKYKFNLTEVN